MTRIIAMAHFEDTTTVPNPDLKEDDLIIFIDEDITNERYVTIKPFGTVAEE
jgi:hypothetical protein